MSAAPTGCTNVFASYSHQYHCFFSALQAYWAVFTLRKPLDQWMDAQLAPVDVWLDKIRRCW